MNSQQQPRGLERKPSSKRGGRDRGKEETDQEGGGQAHYPPREGNPSCSLKASRPSTQAPKGNTWKKSQEKKGKMLRGGKKGKPEDQHVAGPVSLGERRCESQGIGKGIDARKREKNLLTGEESRRRSRREKGRRRPARPFSDKGLTESMAFFNKKFEAGEEKNVRGGGGKFRIGMRAAWSISIGDAVSQDVVFFRV